MPYLTAHSCRYFIYMAKLIRRILTVGGNFKMPRDRHAPEYVLRLLEYYIRMEGLIKETSNHEQKE